MILKDIVKLLDAKVLACEEKLEREVVSACAADLMSDVLAFSKEKGLIITGLINPQVIRTAEMMDFKAVIIARGKTVTPEIIELALEKSVVLIATNNTLFKSCGILYENGLGR